jgi:serine phosphatase RsbU (regulator of sigma subunit)
LANSITKRIFELIKGAEKLSKNQFEHHIPVEGRDELSQLALAFNSMSSRLNNLFHTLEDKVADRTEKLSTTLETLRIAQKKMMDSINYASVIQHSLLPVDKNFSRFVSDSFVIWQPRDVVGGDIYFYREYDDGFLLFAIDCTGHGVPGAFMTMITGAVLENSVREDNRRDPAKIFGEMNRTIRKALNQDRDDTRSDDGLDAIAIYYSYTDEKVLFAGAKNHLIYIKSGEVNTLKGDKMSIGYKRSDPDFQFTNQELIVDSDIQLYLLTDGITDQPGGKKGRMFGNRRLKEVLLENHKLPFSEQEKIVLKSYREYKGERGSVDDITLLGIKIDKKGV